MNLAIQKTLSFILLIGVGLLLKKKISKKEHLGGIKTLILSIALPATIFIALLKINIDTSLLVLPVLALGFNLITFMVARYVLPWGGIEANSPENRTLRMLLPSLAPGLSCFPFIEEYLGEESLAWAALADVGNKVFVLIILYLVAMNWFNQLYNTEKDNVSDNRLKGLVMSLLQEPVNLVIVTAVVMLSFGLNMTLFPTFIQEAISRMSLLMTPLILVFIGLAVKVKWGEIKMILSLLLLRSGFAFMLSAILLLIHPIASISAALVTVIFPQSACSFWPFAHMSAIEHLESRRSKEEQTTTGRTFDTALALNVLAFSLPFSTTLILIICSVRKFFIQPTHLLILAGAMFILATVPNLIQRLSKSTVSEEKDEVDADTIDPAPVTQYQEAKN